MGDKHLWTEHPQWKRPCFISLHTPRPSRAWHTAGVCKMNVWSQDWMDSIHRGSQDREAFPSPLAGLSYCSQDWGNRGRSENWGDSDLEGKAVTLTFCSAVKEKLGDPRAWWQAWMPSKLKHLSCDSSMKIVTTNDVQFLEHCRIVP